MSFEKLTGLIAAPFTAFDAKGNVNFDMIPKQVESLVAQGVSGAYVSGTTGEGVSCSLQERMEIMDAPLWLISSPAVPPTTAGSASSTSLTRFPEAIARDADWNIMVTLMTAMMTVVT